MERPRVLVPLAEGFEEIEAVTAIDVLRRAGAEVVLATLNDGAGPVKGSRGVSIVAETTLAAAGEGPYAMIVLPGGKGGADRLAADERVVGLVRTAMSRGLCVGAICAAPGVVLGTRGLLAGRAATGHPAHKDKVPSWRADHVVTDGTLVTSQGPGTAMEFSLALVERLFGPSKVKELRDAMIAPPSAR